jgi:hypothetical protein
MDTASFHFVLFGLAAALILNFSRSPVSEHCARAAAFLEYRYAAFKEGLVA